MSEETASNSSEISSYKKKSPLVWVVIYALVGLLVYGAIYYFAFYKKGNNTGYTPTPEVTNTPTDENTVMEEKEPTGDNDEVAAESEIITLTENGFSPQNLTIKQGTKVEWQNESGSDATVNSAPHPEHTAYTPLNLGKFADGETLSLVFDTPGTYKYHNHLNPKQFGSIVVE